MRLWSWFQNLNSNIVALVFLLLGAAMAVGVTHLFRDRRDITFTVSDAPVIVYDATNATPGLRLIDSIGTPITGTVMIETVRVWNSGNLPIDQSDVRSPIRITIGPVERLVDALIVSETDDGISNFRVTPVAGDSALSATVELAWDYFDPGQGVAIQLMYEASRPAEVSVSGRVLGIGAQQFRPAASVPRENILWSSTLNVLLSFLALMMISWVAPAVYGRLVREPMTRPWRLAYGVITILAVAMVYLIALTLILLGAAIPFWDSLTVPRGL